MSAIVCRDLVRIFSAEGVEVQALQGLTLDVQPGELTAIVGASGSGKSTLLNILSGLDVPTAGAASVEGHDLLAMKERDRIDYRRHTVGFVWQQTGRNLIPYLSATENIALTLAVAGVPRKERAPRAEELLGMLDIGELGDRMPAQLSGGQQQRVAIGVALANRPAVLLADEPTGELDEANSALVLETMREVNEQLGVTVLIVTHDPGISDHVRRVVQIRDGRTSTETLRRTALTESGEEHHVAEEFAVLDRVGRMQLPADYVRALELRDRVRLDLATDHVEVFRSDAAPRSREPEPASEPVRGPESAAVPGSAPGSADGPETEALPERAPEPEPAPRPEPEGEAPHPLLRRDLRGRPSDEGDRS
jgi:ABC-type lipoprotein export system ATPase subunit